MTFARRAATVVLGLALAAGLVRAANSKFNAARGALQKQWAAEQQKLGLNPLDTKAREKLFAAYPSPEITLCKVVEVQPDGQAVLELQGKFPEGTVFLADNDAVDLTNATVTAGQFKATVKAAPGQGPGFVNVHAYAPVSGGHVQCGAVFVSTLYSYDLKASNGWAIKATPEAKAFTRKDRNASATYRVAFYKGGEAKPFETVSGNLSLSPGYAPGADLSVPLREGPSGATGELMEIQKKMQDPESFMKMTDKEREAVMERMQALTEKMMKEQQAAIADPAAMQRKEDEFGCRYMTLKTSADGAASGTMTCGRNIGSLSLTGTAKPVK
jgi:hypothetical protein